MDPVLAWVLFLLIAALIAYFRYFDPSAVAAVGDYRARRKNHPAAGARGWLADLIAIRDDYRDHRNRNGRRTGTDDDKLDPVATGRTGTDTDPDDPARRATDHDDDPTKGESTAYACDLCRDLRKVPARSADGHLVSMPCPLCSPASYQPDPEPTKTGYWVRAERIYPEPPAGIGESPRGIPATTEPTTTDTPEPTEPPILQGEPVMGALTPSARGTAIGRTATAPAAARASAVASHLIADGEVDPTYFLGVSESLHQLLSVVAGALEEIRTDLANNGVKDTTKGQPLAALDRMAEHLEQAAQEAKTCRRYAQQHAELEDHIDAVDHSGASMYGRTRTTSRPALRR